MAFHKNILFTLISATTLMTAPVFGMQEDEDPSRKAIPVQKTVEDARGELTVLIGKQNYKEAFAKIRAENSASSDEEIAKFLLASNQYAKYDTLSLEDKRWICESIAGKPVEISIPLTAPAAATEAPPPPTPPKNNGICVIC